MDLDLPGNGSSETMYDEGDRNLAVQLFTLEFSILEPEFGSVHVL